MKSFNLLRKFIVTSSVFLCSSLLSINVFASLPSDIIEQPSNNLVIETQAVSPQINTRITKTLSKTSLSEFEKSFLENQDNIIIESYQNLSEEQKNKFIELINNPLTVQQAMNINLELNQTKSLGNGVITGLIETNEVISNTKATEQSRATYQRYVTIFNIKVFETTSWVQYTHNGSNILSVDSSNIFTSVNLNPVNKVSYSGKIEWKSTTTAYSQSDITFDLFIEDYGPTIGSGYCQVSGNIHNQTNGFVSQY